VSFLQEERSVARHDIPGADVPLELQTDHPLPPLTSLPCGAVRIQSARRGTGVEVSSLAPASVVGVGGGAGARGGFLGRRREAVFVVESEVVGVGEGPGGGVGIQRHG
jgi:hypothetical protein